MRPSARRRRSPCSGVLGLVIRSGVALGDLYLVAPLGLLLGWPAIFVAIFIAALLLSASSLVLLVSRRVGLKSYVPFGPFLVAGTVITLLRDDNLLGEPAAAAATLIGRSTGPDVLAPFVHLTPPCAVRYYAAERPPCPGPLRSVVASAAQASERCRHRAR